MGAHVDYLETDRVAARNFGDAARRARVRRIVYLGGLATGDAALSEHLKSRIETGEVLRASGVLHAVIFGGMLREIARHAQSGRE